MLNNWQRVAQVVVLIEEILHGHERAEIVALRAHLAAWTVLACDVAERLPVPARAKETVLMPVAPDQEQRLLTPDEAAVLAGPSFTAKRLYRLRGSMPEQAWIRKGGRLYFREGPYRRWLATR